MPLVAVGIVLARAAYAGPLFPGEGRHAGSGPTGIVNENALLGIEAITAYVGPAIDVGETGATAALRVGAIRGVGACVADCAEAVNAGLACIAEPVSAG